MIENELYCDGSFDHKTGLAAYCIVTVEPFTKPTYKVEQVIEKTKASQVETAAVIDALRIATRLYLHKRYGSVIYTDCVHAIAKLNRSRSVPSYVRLVHLKGHQLDSRRWLNMEIEVTDDIKRQHWCDTMARMKLKELIDKHKISATIKA